MRGVVVTVAALWAGVVGSSRSSQSLTDCPSACRCHETTDSSGVTVDCKNMGLTEIPTKFPLNTRLLDLSHNHIEFINELPDMDELVMLNLTMNKVRGIHYDAFDGLDSLTTLVLSHNELTSIDDDIFEWNPLKLKRIYLDHNRFEYIQHFLFYDLAELEEINLSNNILSFVHPHAFTECENLRQLDLSSNHLKEFQSKWVKPLLDTSLIELHLDDNEWQCDCEMEDKLGFFADDQLKSMLESALYRGRSNLQCSDSKNNGNKLWDMTPDRLTSCVKPTITGISKSSEVASGKSLLLKCIATGQPSPTIEWRAPNGDVYRLTSDDFEGVTVHQDGSILIEDIRHSDGGDYNCIAKNTKGSVEAKTTITITGEQKDAIDRDDVDKDWDTDWLDEGDRYYNEKVYDDDGAEIDVGDYGNPGLEQDDIDIEDFVETQERDCPADCDCNSDIVDCSDSGDLPDGSPWTYIPDRIPKTGTHLDMNVNEIKSIGSDICRNYPQLQELKLDENLIDTIHRDAFKSCTKLRILTLRNNKLTTLKDAAFVDLKEVQILVLDNNFLEVIPDFAFAGMDELEYLYIRENKIGSIASKAFHALPQIRFIHLEQNKIEALDHPWIEDASSNKNLKRIFLEENNLMCDHRLTPFKNDFTREESPIYRIIQPSDLQCSYPVAQAGKSLDSVKFDILIEEPAIDDRTDQSGGSAGLLIGGIFLGIVLTALIFVVWRKWNRGNHISRHGRFDYRDINGDDNESRALTADQEAFI